MPTFPSTIPFSAAVLAAKGRRTGAGRGSAGTENQCRLISPPEPGQRLASGKGKFLSSFGQVVLSALCPWVARDQRDFLVWV